MIVFLVFLLHVSHHALGVEVTVSEGAESVVLPCQVDAPIPLESTVTWKRVAPPVTVHVRRNNREQPGDQNELYQGRTALRQDALTSGLLSLTLSRPSQIDSATYNCSVRHAGDTGAGQEVQLRVTSNAEAELAKQRDITAALAGIFGFVALGLAAIIVVCMKKKREWSLAE